MAALGTTLPNAALILGVIVELGGAAQSNSAPTITLPRAALAVPLVGAGLRSTRVKAGADLRVITDTGRATRAKSTPTLTLPKVSLTFNAATQSSLGRAAINLGVIIDVRIAHSHSAFAITHVKGSLGIILGFGVTLSKTRPGIVFELAITLRKIRRGVMIGLRVHQRESCCHIVPYETLTGLLTGQINLFRACTRSFTFTYYDLKYLQFRHLKYADVYG